MELETEVKSLSTDPYAFAIKASHAYFVGWKTVGHIPREISRYVYFFIKEENGKVFGTLRSLKNKASPIPSGGLEFPLSLTFLCKGKWVVDTMEEFIKNFYTFKYNGNRSVDTSDSENEEDDDYQTIVLEQKTRRLKRGKKVNQTKSIYKSTRTYLFLL